MGKDTNPTYRFGDYVLTPHQQSLVLRGEEIRLRPKAFKLLVFLVERSGKVVHREKLLGAVWPDTHVTESALDHTISEIREALNHHGEPFSWIKTIPKVGYQFVGQVDETSAEVGRSDLRIRIALAIALSVSLIAVALWYFGLLLPKATSSPLEIDSIAVLPFWNVTGDEASESLALGIPQSISSRLSRLSQFTVKPSIILQRYQGKEVDPQTVSEEQGVLAVLVGSVERRGDTLFVGVELIDGREKSRLIWGSRYTRHCVDLLAVETDIALQIAEALRLELTAEDSTKLAQNGTSNPAAYHAFMMAMYHRQRWVTADPEDPLPLAIEYMEKALKLDPNFQEANSRLFGFYFSGARTGTMPEEAYAEAREYAEKTIAVDEATVLAQQTKACILWQYDRRWEEAEWLYRRAAELDPGVLEQVLERDFYYLGWQGFLEWMGRREELLAETESRLERLDPFSARQQVSIGYDFLYQREYERAVQQARKALSLEPMSRHGHAILREAYEQLGMQQRSVEVALAVEWPGVSEEEKRRLRELVNELGMDGVRRWELDRRLSGQGRCRPERVAYLYAVIGEYDRAFEWLEKSWERPLWGSENAPSCFWWDPLRGDPRFEQLLRDQNLPEEVIQRHLRVQ